MDILSWWSVPQTARSLGISTPTVYVAIERGRLNVVHTALGVLVDPTSVEAYRVSRRKVRVKGEKVRVPA